MMKKRNLFLKLALNTVVSASAVWGCGMQVYAEEPWGIIDSGELRNDLLDGTPVKVTLTLASEDGEEDGGFDSISKDVTTNDWVILPEAPEKDGYRFLFWYGSYSYVDDCNQEVKGDIIFYTSDRINVNNLIWSTGAENDNSSYQVTLYAAYQEEESISDTYYVSATLMYPDGDNVYISGFSKDEVPADTTWAELGITSNKEWNKDLFADVPDGLEFDGWYVNSCWSDDLSEQPLDVNFKIVDCPYIVGYMKGGSYEVTFDSAGGSKVKSQTIKRGSCIQTIPEPTKSGYIFGGWLNEYGSFYNFDYPVYGNTKLKACWVKQPDINVTVADSNIKTLKVSYLDQYGNALRSTKMNTYKKGTSVTETAPAISGYQVVGSSSKTIGLYSDVDLVFVYEKSDTVSAPSTKRYTLKIQYQDEKGNALAASVLETHKKGTIVTKSAKSIDGYTPVNDSKTKVMNSDQTITFTYRKSEQKVWVQNGNGWMYKDSNGRPMVSSWLNDHGVWYHFDSNGRMETGWKKIAYQGEPKWFYFDHSGAMKTGWLKLEWEGQNDWYYFFGDGVMAASTQVGIYRLDSAGKCLNPND